MKLSFVPANLHLTETGGEFVVSLHGNEVFRSPHSKKAVAQFQVLRKKLEDSFPSHNPSPEEIAELLRQSIANSLVDHNSWRPDERKRKKINSTRTFG